jgi:dienelactone hydrolase
MNAKHISPPEDGYVRINAGSGVLLDADLALPHSTHSVVVFAHGSGSNRYSPRNRFVARSLHQAGLGTLLVSLLTAEEEAQDIIRGHLRFDIALLGRRLTAVVDWLHENPQTRHLTSGIFGSSTGAAGALLAAADRPALVAAVVSRGGRPDLAASALDRVKAPTLLIVGGNDTPVIDFNRKALATLHAEKKLVIVPGATHLFEEPGALEQVVRLATDWFVTYLDARNAPPAQG